ncbi:MAG: type II toxin-antitoxin system VapC family toxin [Rhizobiaceae bacterium]
MKLLIDTQLLVWSAIDAERLSKRAEDILSDDQNELHFSIVSLWEIVIKSGLGRTDFNVDAAVLREGLLVNGYFEIVIGGHHAIAVRNLARLHNDPFDRMLLAQAAVEEFSLVTTDEVLAKYPGSIIRV